MWKIFWSIARVRALAHKCYVTEVLVKEKEVKLTMYQKAKINVGGIPDLVNSYGGALKLVPGEVPVFHYVERKPKGITIEDMLFKAEEILKGIKKAADVRVRSFFNQMYCLPAPEWILPLPLLPFQGLRQRS